MVSPLPFPARLEWFERVGSTNDVVADWLRDAVPEVCVAVADEQTAGRGRNGRTWVAPPNAALLCSVGFRPTWLDPERPWRLAAIVALAMADAAEDVAGLAQGTIRMKWPNDLVVTSAPPEGGPEDRPEVGREAASTVDAPSDLVVRKLAGILGETEALGASDARTVIGIGLNADWARVEFPPDLASGMTSLREASGGQPIDRRALLDGFLVRLEPRVEALRGGRFDVSGWTDRQLTNGRPVRLDRPDGTSEIVRALGVDGVTGALVVDDPANGRERHVLVGEIQHLRIGGVV